MATNKKHKDTSKRRAELAELVGQTWHRPGHSRPEHDGVVVVRTRNSHERVGGGAVSVLLTGRAVEGLAGVGLDLFAAAGQGPRDALGDVQRLAEGV